MKGGGASDHQLLVSMGPRARGQLFRRLNAQGVVSEAEGRVEGLST